MMEKLHLKKLFNAYQSGDLIVFNTFKDGMRIDEPCEKYQTLFSAFMFPTAGNATIHLDDMKIKAETGKLIYIPHTSIIGFEVVKESNFEYINIFHQVAERFHFQLDIQHINSEILKILLDLVNLGSPTETKDIVQKDIYINKLFHLLLDQKYSYQSNEQEVIESLISYIESNYDQEITLEKLARLVEKKESQISYLFKKYTNKRPIDYVIHYRLNKAIHLLKTTNLSINEIAPKVGYHDPFYFSRLFKKHTGIPPSTFRLQRQ